IPLSGRLALSDCRLRPRLSPPRVIRGGSEESRGFFALPRVCSLSGFGEGSSPDAGPAASGTRLHRDPAHVPFAAALGGYIRIAAQGEMDDTTLVRRHWLQDDRPPRTSDLPSDSLGQANERLFAPGAVALDVDHHAGPVLEAPVGDEVDQVLQLGEMIAAAADEHAQVLPQDLDEYGRRIFRVERHGRGIVDGDHVCRDPHLPEQLAHNLLGDLLLGFVDTLDVAHAFGHGYAR